MTISGERTSASRNGAGSAFSIVLLRRSIDCARPPTLLRAEKLPDEMITKHIWDQRYEDINAFEQYLTRNGVVIRKFFLHFRRKSRRSGSSSGWKIQRRTGNSPWQTSTNGLLEGLPGSLRGDDSEYRGETRAVVLFLRTTSGLRADRRFRDYRALDKLHLSFQK